MNTKNLTKPQAALLAHVIAGTVPSKYDARVRNALVKLGLIGYNDTNGRLVPMPCAIADREADRPTDKAVKAGKPSDEVKIRQAKAHGPKPTNDCLCGCGGQTPRSFLQGHDAKAKSRLMKEHGMTMEQIMSKGVAHFAAEKLS